MPPEVMDERDQRWMTSSEGYWREEEGRWQKDENLITVNVVFVI